MNMQLQAVIQIYIVQDMILFIVKMEYLKNVYMEKKILNMHLNMLDNFGGFIKIIKDI